MNTKALAVSAFVAVAAVVALTALDAAADKTVVWRTVDAEVTSMTFTPLVDGGSMAHVCGRTKTSTGAFTEGTCYDTPTTGQIRTDVNNIKTLRALPFWRTEEGL